MLISLVSSDLFPSLSLRRLLLLLLVRINHSLLQLCSLDCFVMPLFVYVYKHLSSFSISSRLPLYFPPATQETMAPYRSSRCHLYRAISFLLLCCFFFFFFFVVVVVVALVLVIVFVLGYFLLLSFQSYLFVSV